MTRPDRIPVILDFDDAVLPVAGNEIRLPLQSWQEKIRFGCTKKHFARLQAHLQRVLPDTYGCVFLGSGDYHHVTPILLARVSEPVDLIVCDNHPDNMRYWFGIHCGSWVYYASRLPNIRHIHVLGISSADISCRHAWENYLTPLYQGKLTYWSVGVKARWLDYIGLRSRHYCFTEPEALIEAFIAQIAGKRCYLSIDKDVFSPDVIRTNWDQGQFQEAQLQRLISACQGKVVGADVTGEVSEYHYTSRFKRFLSQCDGQPAIDPAELHAWQVRQQLFNRHVLTLLEPAFV